ncbi:patatin-like phospholipase family protein [Anaerotalea alkaliphila]|uniref:Patatin-like phospholipase family protein n=1 Tax=Anaerotalea alkaliphila TaxID=2662126 RepID=A0A7X5KMD1_9FIRM|nr:patatin-like phospholipase family protein [Anaerotalea alkaliphila]
MDKTKQYGVALEGGGARGAYQVGAWKALMEEGIQVRTVVGTSVGALNGALFVQGDMERTLRIWRNIDYQTVFQVEDSLIDEIRNFNLKEFNLMDLDLQKILKPIKKWVKDGGLDITPLKRLIDQEMDEGKVRESPMEFGLVTVSLTDMKPLEIFLEDIGQGELGSMLLASSYLPAFKSEKIGGKTYLDGAFHNNLPLTMLVRKGIRDIIVIRLGSFGLQKKVDTKDLNIIEIEPREDLGMILEFDPERIGYNMDLGYHDALRVLRDLEGSTYYIQNGKSEAWFLNRFLRTGNQTLRLAREEGKLFYRSRGRLLFEGVLPYWAKRLKLEKEWDYRDLGIAVLEALALSAGIPRFQVLEVEELVRAIRKAGREGTRKAGALENGVQELLPQFWSWFERAFYGNK